MSRGRFSTGHKPRATQDCFPRLPPGKCSTPRGRVPRLASLTECTKKAITRGKIATAATRLTCDEVAGHSSLPVPSLTRLHRDRANLFRDASQGTIHNQGQVGLGGTGTISDSEVRDSYRFNGESESCVSSLAGIRNTAPMGSKSGVVRISRFRS